jgi:hypothetical protein
VGHTWHTIGTQKLSEIEWKTFNKTVDPMSLYFRDYIFELPQCRSIKLLCFAKDYNILLFK